MFAGFLQFDVRSGDIENNLARVEAGLAEINTSNDRISPGIIVLPELWATGFAYEKLAGLAKKVPGLLENLRDLSAKYNIHIAGSLPEYSENSYYNTLFITGPTGITGKYRKQRLFSPMQEDSYFTAGENIQPMETPLGRLAGLVCYDLRFPELLRQQTSLGANLLAIAAQWPAARVDHWRVLVQARAIENQMFVVACNRCGTTGDTIFGGHSMIVGPDGAILLEAGDGEENKGTMLDLEMIITARALFRTVPATK